MNNYRDDDSHHPEAVIAYAVCAAFGLFFGLLLWLTLGAS